MKKRMRDAATRTVAIMMIAVTVMTSCTPQMAGPAPMGDEALKDRAITLLDASLDDTVIDALRKEGIPELDSMLAGKDAAYETVTRSLGGDGGREYLEFLVAAGDFSASPDGVTVDEVFRAAEGRCPEEQLEDAREQVRLLEEKLGEEYERESRALTVGQQKQLYRDLRRLVVKAAVLLTSAIVYANVPQMMFWGKVSAASACAVAAGILAATLTSLVELHRTGSPHTTFTEWMEDVAKEPTAAWAIASGLISTNMAMGHSPVLTAIVIAVFAVYGIADDVKPLLKKYAAMQR